MWFLMCSELIEYNGTQEVEEKRLFLSETQSRLI
jgi:hypothetical protein